MVIHRKRFLAGLSRRSLLTRVWAQAPSLETFTQWIRASKREREDAVKACLERIQRTLERRSTHGSKWRHNRLGDGALAGIRSARRTSWKRAGLSTE